jgi:threonine dehydrogenase-like Zn-dependent dehydrogenase
MKAVVVEQCGEVVWRDVPDVPAPGPYQAIVRVRAFAICNSTDKHLRDCKLMGATAETCPFLLGHEAAGEVVEVGSKCRYLKVGDQALRPMAEVDGYGSYWGGFAEFGPVADRRAYEEDVPPGASGATRRSHGGAVEKGGPPDDGPRIHKGHQVVPPEIAPGAAVMLITLKEVLSYLDRIGANAGGRLLVMGHGPVGLAAAYLGRRVCGCERIVVAGRRPEAEAQALDFGADAYVDLRADDWPAHAAELLGGPATSVYDTTGQPALVSDALGILADDGVLGPYAARPSDAEGTMPEDPRMIDAGTDEGLSHDRILEAVQSGAIDPSVFISHVLRPDQIAEGFDLIDRREAIKVLFEV